MEPALASRCEKWFLEGYEKQAKKEEEEAKIRGALMRKKDEQKADAGLSMFLVKPKIYHYTFNVLPFTAITIAAHGFSWDIGRQRIDEALLELWNHEPAPATRTLRLLRANNIHGVAICDYGDQFNARRGRTIAKGRLLKHLKHIKEEKKKRNEK